MPHSPENLPDFSLEPMRPNYDLNWPGIVQCDIDIARACHKHACIGKFLIYGLASLIDFEKEVGDYAPHAQFVARVYEGNIFKHHWEGIANLCLPFRIHHMLTSEGVETIPQLIDFLEGKYAIHIEGIGEKRKEQLRKVVDYWHTLPDIRKGQY